MNLGGSDLKKLLGFCSSGSQYNLQTSTTKLPWCLVTALPPSSVLALELGSLLAGALTLRASLSHTLCQPLVYPLYLAMDCQLQGGSLRLLFTTTYQRSSEVPWDATSQGRVDRQKTTQPGNHWHVLKPTVQHYSGQRDNAFILSIQTGSSIHRCSP